MVTLRGVVTGEYVVNLHYYATETKKPVQVQVRLVKVNPKLEVIYYGTILMEKTGSEKTALRFRVNRSGAVDNINFLPKMIVFIGQEVARVPAP